MKTFMVRLVLGVGCLALMSAIVPPVSANASESIPPKIHHEHFYVVHGHRVGTFSLANDVQIHLGANSSAYLRDLTVGQTAHVNYTVENGFLVAHQIAVNLPGAKAATGTASTTGATPAANTPQLHEHHVHGVILSYDTSAGTITIRDPR